ncbi:cytochrome c oxidase assembly protein [Gracilibacillus caseinilyticus]|uniref:Cytochrome c oxidase assembly protein n=1 Tax=Gracilibacillus caseinilyticus TaxID=2932256 RepID=A0ABY4F099_9BACI|nr:cytochrome c oxidase assembly protein [Gracilibacillus caseinilyticus]UOQ49334.1 cytochrome c oxidase assembly protein [Gracilibacillus caseinilyticus]
MTLWVFLMPLTWNIPVLFVLLASLICYLLLLRRLTVTVKQVLFMVSCLLLCGITFASPFAQLAHITFSTHMIQMSILYFIIPPLLLLGMPHTIHRIVSNTSIMRHRTSIISLLLFSVLFLLYHLPAMLQFLLQHPLLHNSYSLLLFALAISMWWPFVLLPTEKVERYAFFSGVFVMPACLLFVVMALLDLQSSQPFHQQLFAHLCLPDRTLASPVNTKIDQVMAGVIMLGMHKGATHLAIRGNDG